MQPSRCSKTCKQQTFSLSGRGTALGASPQESVPGESKLGVKLLGLCLQTRREQAASLLAKKSSSKRKWPHEVALVEVSPIASSRDYREYFLYCEGNLKPAIDLAFRDGFLGVSYRCTGETNKGSVHCRSVALPPGLSQGKTQCVSPLVTDAVQVANAIAGRQRPQLAASP